ncbi:DUF3991 and toprim domain-containing protein [Aerococcaceae bacterium NML191292]|nr:DUF3991 and toprim domain-containing protein [Aerococcaceae bacterium NML191292]
MAQKKTFKRKRFTQEQLEKAMSVPIVDYIEAKGIGQLIQHGHNYMKLRYDGHDSLVIDLRKNEFIHNAYAHEKNARGNLINFVQYIQNNEVGFVEAVQEILEFAGEDYIPVERIIEEKEFIYDYVEAKYNSRAYNYLVKERCINREIVNRLFEERYIIQDKYNNVIFNWTVDGLPPKEPSNIIGATQQLTRQPDEGMASKWIKEGSQKDSGFNIQLGKRTESVYFFEAAIDMLSYWSLYYDSLNNCRLISLEGLKQETIKNYLTQVTEAGYTHYNVYMCVDNDGAAFRLMENIPITSDTSPVKIIENIPFQNVLTSQEYHRLKEASEAYAADMNQMMMVYLAERPLLQSKPTTKEKQQLIFIDGIEKGVARISSEIRNYSTLDDFFLAAGYSVRQRDRIDRWQREGVFISETGIKDWNDFLKLQPEVYSLDNVPEALLSEKIDSSRDIIEPARESELESPSLQETIQQTTRRLEAADLERLQQTTAISPQVLKIFADKGWLRKSTQEEGYVLLWSKERQVTGAEHLSPSLDYQATQQYSKDGESFIFTVGKPENLIVFESSKEAMSYLTLYPQTKDTAFIVAPSGKNLNHKIQEYLEKGNIKSITYTFEDDRGNTFNDRGTVEVHHNRPISNSWHQDIEHYQEYQTQKKRVNSLEKTLKEQQKQLEGKREVEMTM